MDRTERNEFGIGLRRWKKERERTSLGLILCETEQPHFFLSCAGQNTFVPMGLSPRTRENENGVCLTHSKEDTRYCPSAMHNLTCCHDNFRTAR